MRDATPDALAFRVTGTIADVANAVSSMFEEGFTWEATYDSQDWKIESVRTGEGSFEVRAYMNGELVWWTN